MSSYKGLYSLTGLSEKGTFQASQIRHFYWYPAFFVTVAVLEFGQDYISSILYGNQFQLIESLSYKLFWLFFIPFSMAIDYGLVKANEKFSRLPYFVCNAFLVLLLTIVHLIVFSLALFGVSTLIQEAQWTLPALIYEKLSTRLYIALTIYLTLSAIYFLVERRKSKRKSDRQIYRRTISVKNGRSSVLVDVSEIKWIGSDGPYLDIHTTGQKHVVLDSLKNIIKTLPDNFKRIHRSTIVNIDGIKELKSRGNGDYDVIMDDQQVLRLSRNYTKPLKGLLF